MAGKKQENKGDNVLVIKLQEHKTPEFKEVRGKEYITIGANNDYPEYLLKLYDRSGKHNAIVNQKSFYIYGGGSEAGEDIVVNEDGETLNDVTKKIILDHELFGGFALEVIWSLGGKKAEFRHVNFSHIRSNEDNSKFFFTKDWVKYYYDSENNCITLPNSIPEKNADWTTWPAYNPAKPIGKQLYYYKCYRPGVDTYPLPEYIGAIPFIEIDFEIANFWLNSVKNGFTASHIVTLYGDAGTQEEQKKLEERIKKKFTGTDNGGRIILNFSANKEKGGSEIANITPQDLDKQFQILNETIQQEIFTGHRIISPMLLGIKTPGQLGGRSEMVEANELFQNVVISPKQQLFGKILTKLTNQLLGIKEEITLRKIVPIGIDLVNSNNAWSMLDEDEKREAIGKPPFTPEQQAQRQAEQDAKNAQAVAIANGNGGQKFSDMKNQVNVFKKYSGVGKKGTLIACRQILPDADGDIKLYDSKFVKQDFAALRNNQRSVLDLLNKDPMLPSDRIAEALSISVEEVNNIIQFLLKRDLLEASKAKTGDGTATVRVLTPVRDAIKILEDTPAPTANIFTVYGYEYLPQFADVDPDTSREICQELMDESAQREAAGNLWTREEINQIGNEMGWDFWTMRGGWYTKPGTDIHIPHCRHIWVQHLYTIEE